MRVHWPGRRALELVSKPRVQGVWHRVSILLHASLPCWLMAACVSGARPTGKIVRYTSSATEVTSANGDASGERTRKPGLELALAKSEAERIMVEVARARELEVSGTVSVRVVDGPAVRAFARKSMYEHTTPEEIRLLTRVDASLGVLPPGADGEKILLDMLEQAVLGIYDPDENTLLIGQFIPKSLLTMVVGHEIAHGLQDMHFDLDSLQKPLKGQTDREAARTFLLEGDAQAAYLAWLGRERGLAAIDDNVFLAMGNQALDLQVSPYPILARALQLPYADGAATIARLVRHKGWRAVDELYERLPTTSEQMLHVDKLLSREPAIDVKIDVTPLRRALVGHTVVYEDNLGEATLLAMLAQVEPSTVARQSAAGWGGDRFVALDAADKQQQPPVVVGLIAWDSERDAAEFELSFRKYLDQQVGREMMLIRKRDLVVFATRVSDDVDRTALEHASWRAFTVARGAGGARAHKHVDKEKL